MNEVVSEFVSNQVLFFSALGLIVLGLLILITTMLVSNKKRKQLNEMVQLTEIPKKVDVTANIKTIFDDRNSKLIEKTNIEEKPNDEEKTDIQKMLEKMQSDLEEQQGEDVSTFEQEQEEKSIISYQELLKSAKKENEEIEENNINTEVSDFISQIKGESEIKKDEKKFKGTEFISPIFGRVGIPENQEYRKIERPTKKKKEEIELFEYEDMDDVLASNQTEEAIHFPKHAHDELAQNLNTDIDKTLDLTNLQVELKHNDEFLKSLKEFRKNLE